MYIAHVRCVYTCEGSSLLIKTTAFLNSGTLTHSLSPFTTETDRFNKAPATGTGFPYIAATFTAARATRLSLPRRKYQREISQAAISHLQVSVFYPRRRRIIDHLRVNAHLSRWSRGYVIIAVFSAVLLGRMQISKVHGTVMNKTEHTF